MHSLAGHSSRVFAVAFCRNGKRVFSVSGDKLVKIWDTATGAEVMSSFVRLCRVW